MSTQLDPIVDGDAAGLFEDLEIGEVPLDAEDFRLEFLFADANVTDFVLGYVAAVDETMFPLTPVTRASAETAVITDGLRY